MEVLIRKYTQVFKLLWETHSRGEVYINLLPWNIMGDDVITINSPTKRSNNPFPNIFAIIHTIVTTGELHAITRGLRPGTMFYQACNKVMNEEHIPASHFLMCLSYQKPTRMKYDIWLSELIGEAPGSVIARQCLLRAIVYYVCEYSNNIRESSFHLDDIILTSGGSVMVKKGRSKTKVCLSQQLQTIADRFGVDYTKKEYSFMSDIYCAIAYH